MLKDVFYHGARWTGAFRMARRATTHGVRILGYHGFPLADEQHFRPGLFLESEAFRQRMQHLVRNGYPVLSLDAMIQCLQRGKVPAGATVLTFDDGFYSIWKCAVPILEEFALPATIYVTTYYCLKGTPVFRLAVQYMFWKTRQASLNLHGLGLEDEGTVRFVETASAEAAMWRIIRHGETRLNEDQRVQLSEELGRRLAVDYAEIVEKRFLSLMTLDEIREAAKRGIDIQLHTHRHRLPLEEPQIRREIEHNREVLEPLVGYRPQHLCYPSGEYHQEHLPALKRLGILSATTCDSGLNCQNTPLLTLFRFLDGSDVSQITFEAEMCGLAGLLRRCRPRRR